MARDLMSAGGSSEPWGLEAGAVADELGTDVQRGLTAEEAAARLARYGPNRLDAPDVLLSRCAHERVAGGVRPLSDGRRVEVLATQILWINLLTGSAPALALGVDPPPDDVMAPPASAAHRPDHRRPDVDGIVWVGLVMATVTLVALDLRLEGGIFGGSGGIDEARTMAITTLVLAQLFNCFNARSDTTSAFHHFFTNCLLWAAIAFSVLMQIAVVHLSILNDAFNTTLGQPRRALTAFPPAPRRGNTPG